MDFTFTPEEEAFRSEIRTFLDAQLPANYGDRAFVGDVDGSERSDLARSVTRALAEKEPFIQRCVTQ